jgi:hypothetical protein
MSNLSEVYKSETFVLIPQRRTFIGGMSSLIGSAGKKIQENYATSKTSTEADTKAIAADWRAVGNDLKNAYEWGAKETAK